MTASGKYICSKEDRSVADGNSSAQRPAFFLYVHSCNVSK